MQLGFAEMVSNGFPPELPGILSSLWFSEGWRQIHPDAAAAFAASALDHQTPAHVAEVCGIIASRDSMFERLSGWSIPTTAVFMSEDGQTPRDAAEPLLRRIGAKELLWSGGHLPMIEAQEHFDALVRSTYAANAT